MKNALALLIICFTLCLSKNNAQAQKKTETESSTTLLGMVLLNEVNSLNMEEAVAEMEDEWQLKFDEKSVGDTSSVLSLGDYIILVANMEVPIPTDEVKTTAEFTYLWTEGVIEAIEHKSHVLVVISNAGKDPVKENILFNKVAASILKHSNSSGMYIGSRTLLLEKDFFLTSTESITGTSLPIYTWVYLGLNREKGKQSIYTYGLAEFGKKEMEIINSKKNVEELSAMMYNMVHYVLEADVTLKDGETIGMSASQRLKIKESKGVYLEGKTLKIEF